MSLQWLNSIISIVDFGQVSAGRVGINTVGKYVQ